MRILFASNDIETQNSLKETGIPEANQLTTLDKNNDPVEVVSSIYKLNPSIVILDDDFLNPNSGKIIQSIRELMDDISIVFVTGNDTIELGREISQLGIEYYVIKPYTKEEMEDSLNSLIKHQLKKQQSNSN
jgi:DNA-binding NarL/FixJ family response regulator